RSSHPGRPTGFKRLFLDAAASGSYAAILSVLVVCEGLYLDWASKAPAKRPESFVHHEWISLHDYPEFRELVDFLRRELDRVGPSDAQRAREFFSRAVELEQLFFDESYTHPLP
uniref:TenA family protein n=1 Tax=uncultured Rothia sp. TaxID=316088 RepID=UPI0025E6FF2E